MKTCTDKMVFANEANNENLSRHNKTSCCCKLFDITR